MCVLKLSVKSVIEFVFNLIWSYPIYSCKASKHEVRTASAGPEQRGKSTDYSLRRIGMRFKSRKTFYVTEEWRLKAIQLATRSVLK
jgi:hypothetical protein